MRWQMCCVRFLCAPLHPCTYLRRVQLRIIPRPLRHLRWPGHFGRVLLQGVHQPGERPRRLPQDCESGILKDRPVLRAEKVRLQKEVADARPLSSPWGMEGETGIHRPSRRTCRRHHVAASASSRELPCSVCRAGGQRGQPTRTGYVSDAPPSNSRMHRTRRSPRALCRSRRTVRATPGVRAARCAPA